MNIRTPKDAGHYIASARKALKWTQSDLAVKIGKDQRFVSRLENDPASVSFGTVLMVLNTLNIHTVMTNSHLNKKSITVIEPHTNSHTALCENNDTPTKKQGLSKWASTPVKLPTIVSKKKK